METIRTDEKSRRERLASAVLQYLNDHGYTQAFESLKLESGLEYEEGCMPRPHLLQAALDAYDEAHKPAAGVKDELKETLLDELLKRSNESKSECCQKLSVTCEGVHNTNIICCAYAKDGSFLATGSVDKTVAILDPATGALRHRVDGFPSPILSVDVHPTDAALMLASCMDGSHHVFNQQSKSILQRFNAHQKYVTKVAFNVSGSHYITLSTDHTANIYARRPSSDEYEHVKQLQFQAAVQAVVWLGESKLILTVREDNYYRTYDVSTMKEVAKRNMNANGDDHVSFTAMDLALSKDNRLLLVATDKHRLILFHTDTGKQIRNYYGASNDSFSNPMCCWSADETHVYSTSHGNHSIVAWDVGSEKVVATLSGHKKVLRAMAHHPTQETIASCSYDKTVKFWEA